MKMETAVLSVIKNLQLFRHQLAISIQFLIALNAIIWNKECSWRNSGNRKLENYDSAAGVFRGQVPTAAAPQA